MFNSFFSEHAASFSWDSFNKIVNFWGNFIEEMREVHHGIFAFGVLSASVYDGFMNSCV